MFKEYHEMFDKKDVSDMTQGIFVLERTSICVQQGWTCPYVKLGWLRVEVCRKSGQGENNF